MNRDRLKLIGRVAYRALAYTIPPQIVVGILVLTGVLTPKTWFHTPLSWFVFSFCVVFLLMFFVQLFLALKFPSLYNRP